ncbi:endonuclease Q family protein [Paenibacillus brevis]|uniref:Endonuclease Q family protein n=1 Tax=Paenibacillus brevis TaxID=2841508 RepID=A0ABS6FQV1_9BACL|nr:endonuclease Q family protein [Paenibacillus brevis]MBU5672607.1 endonuclease Q family protein [Paenibacillus brevis]
MEQKLVSIYADLHIHIGKTSKGAPVKISGSRNLTFANIAKEAAERKGIGLIGIIDCHSPGVQQDIMACLEEGTMRELDEGGIAYRSTTILLGSEIEIREAGMGPAHLLVFFPYLEQMVDFSGWMSKHMKNIHLSSQRIYVSAHALQEEVYARGGMMIPAHIFTPHRSIYGSCSPRMADVLDLDRIAAVELGLSSDSQMAGWISELDRYPLLSNSDAHSLGKIGREYNELLLSAPSYSEFERALSGQDGRSIVANYGLDPRLGKYHRSFCSTCGTTASGDEPMLERCPSCGSKQIVRGVLDRILSIADRPMMQVPKHRPPYFNQVPLDFIPGLGPAKLDRLLEHFGTEMNILHRVPEEELARVVGPELAGWIAAARSGRLSLQSGGGGIYGKVGQ